MFHHTPKMLKQIILTLFLFATVSQKYQSYRKMSKINKMEKGKGDGDHWQGYAYFSFSPEVDKTSKHQFYSTVFYQYTIWTA
jgi:hypothetical protein